MIGQSHGTRIQQLDYEWDYLGNQIRWLDDAFEAESLGEMFYERGIGEITNGNTPGASSSSARPSALYLSTNIDTEIDGGVGVDPSWNGAGWVEVEYGVSGNVASFTVHGQCHDASLEDLCTDSTGTVAERADHFREVCACAQEQHYRYRWDELNRLVEGLRYDRDTGSDWTYGARLRYRYDGANQRTVKQSYAASNVNVVERHALYVYPGDFERRGLTIGFGNAGPSYLAVAGTADATETQYLIAGARIVWDGEPSITGPGIDRNRRATVSASDLLGTTAASLDLESGALLEVSTYYPNGARENLWANEADVPLEPMGFTGKEADEEIGVTYFGERWLIPRLGRWATPDPLHVHAAGGGEALNSYHYVSGNLLQARDPLGLDVQEYDGSVRADPRYLEQRATQEQATITLQGDERAEIRVGGRTIVVDQSRIVRRVPPSTVELNRVFDTYEEALEEVYRWVESGVEGVVAYYRDGDLILPTEFNDQTSPRLMIAVREIDALRERVVGTADAMARGTAINILAQFGFGALGAGLGRARGRTPTPPSPSPPTGSRAPSVSDTASMGVRPPRGSGATRSTGARTARAPEAAPPPPSTPAPASQPTPPPRQRGTRMRSEALGAQSNNWMRSARHSGGFDVGSLIRSSIASSGVGSESGLNSDDCVPSATLMRTLAMTTDSFVDDFERALEANRSGDPARAVVLLLGLLHRAENRRQRFSVLRVLGGVYLYELGDNGSGEQYFREAVQIAPRSEAASLGLVHSLMGLGREDKAFDEMRRFLSLRASAEYSRILEDILRDTDEAGD